MQKSPPFNDKWASLTDAELERLLDEAFRAVAKKLLKEHENGKS